MPEVKVKNYWGEPRTRLHSLDEIDGSAHILIGWTYIRRKNDTTEEWMNFSEHEKMMKVGG